MPDSVVRRVWSAWLIQVAVRSLSPRQITEVYVGFASAVLSAVPLVVLLIVFQRQIIRGLTAGAVKG